MRATWTHPDPDQHLLPFPLIAAPLVRLIQTPHGRVLGHDTLGDRFRHARQRREHLDVRVLEVLARDDLVFGRAEHGNVRVLEASARDREQPPSIRQVSGWGERGRERRGSLVGFLTDVERDLLEPVGRLRDLVDAHEHAASLHLKPVRQRQRGLQSARSGVLLKHPDELTGLRGEGKKSAPDQRQLEIILARLSLSNPRQLLHRLCRRRRRLLILRPRRTDRVPVLLLPRPFEIAREGTEAVQHDEQVDVRREEARLDRGDVIREGRVGDVLREVESRTARVFSFCAKSETRGLSSKCVRATDRKMSRESSSTTIRSLPTKGTYILRSSLHIRSHTRVHLTAPSQQSSADDDDAAFDRAGGHSTSQSYTLRRVWISRLMSSQGDGFVAAVRFPRFLPPPASSAASASSTAWSGERNAVPLICIVSSAVETFLSPARSVLASRSLTRSAVSSRFNAVFDKPALPSLVVEPCRIRMPVVSSDAEGEVKSMV